MVDQRTSAARLLTGLINRHKWKTLSTILATGSGYTGGKVMERRRIKRALKYEEPQKFPSGKYICPECKDAIVIWRTPVEAFKIKCPKCNTQMVRTATPFNAQETPEQYMALNIGAQRAAALKGVRLKPPVQGSTGLKKAMSGLKEAYDPAKKSIGRFLKKPTTRGVAIAGAGGGYYLGRRKKKSEGYALYQLYKKNPTEARIAAAQYGIALQPLLVKYAAEASITGWELGKKHGEEEAAGLRPPPGALKLAWLIRTHGDAYPLGRQRALTRVGLSGGTREGSSFLENILEKIGTLLSGEKESDETLRIREIDT